MKYLLVLGLLVSGSFANAAVCFFEHDNFGGQRFCLNPGDVVYDLARSGWNDKISSITVNPGEVARICKDSNFRNVCYDISSTTNSLRYLGMNDETSSIQVSFRGGGPGWGGGPGGGPGHGGPGGPPGGGGPGGPGGGPGHGGPGHGGPGGGPHRP